MCAYKKLFMYVCVVSLFVCVSVYVCVHDVLFCICLSMYVFVYVLVMYW